MNTPLRTPWLTAALAALCLSGCAHTPPAEPADPLEPVNRAVFSFNRAADRYVLRPVAKGYTDITPAPVQRGVGNFFSNLGEPLTIVNGLLQGKFEQAASDTGRFLLNTTAGLGGVMDVATNAGLSRHDEDFGQSLGRVGIGPGWYLMLPLLGPSNNRDLLGRAGDYFGSPSPYLHDDAALALGAAGAVNLRAQLLPADSLIDGADDPYIFVRTAYLESRLRKTYDGNPPAKYLYGEDE